MATTPAPFLRLENISLAYNDAPILERVQMELRPGEVCALIGHSGTGKTSLLHAMSGIIPVHAGEITFRGQNVTELQGKERQQYLSQRLGLVFQAFHIVPFLSVADNVALSPIFGHTWSGSVLREKVAEVLEYVGLGGMLDKPARELSGGQRQRVAIARAIINKPDCILADEPTGNLDEATGDQVMEMLVRLAREQGSSMLFVTHEEHYLRLADRVYEVKDGTVAERKL